MHRASSSRVFYEAAKTSLKWARRVNINDLPDDLLLEILSLVPMKALVLKCRPVCTRWRDLVDLPVLWKRMYERKASPEDQESKAVFNLLRLKRNLIKNPCGYKGLRSWTMKASSRRRWKTESLSPKESAKLRSEDFPKKVKKCFKASEGLCVKSQRITLKDAGYWDELIDEARPDIVVKERYYNSSGFCHELRVKLLTADSGVLRRRFSNGIEKLCFHTREIWSRSYGSWKEISYTFRDYPPGVRHILFEHRGENLKPKQHGGRIRITQSSITLVPHSPEEDYESDSSYEYNFQSPCFNPYESDYSYEYNFQSSRFNPYGPFYDYDGYAYPGDHEDD